MNSFQQQKIPATYIRGGTSKGVFFTLSDLPECAQQAGSQRDALLLRVMGSPDPYGKQIDGMGGATSSTSKVVIVSKSSHENHDVDYLFGQVSIAEGPIDWSGNCGNLTAAVGAYAIEKKLVDGSAIPNDGIMTIRIWQVNIQKTIIAHVPIANGLVQEMGDFELDGVTFPAAEIKIEFIDPAANNGSLFPTGNVTDELNLPQNIVESGRVTATFINAGIPTIFIDANALGLTGIEKQSDVNESPSLLQKLEAIRVLGAQKMGLIKSPSDSSLRQHTPKIAFVARAQSYTSSSGEVVRKENIDLVVRALSMGKLHHAMMGTAAVAIASAAVIPGTVVNLVSSQSNPHTICFGHPSGVLRVGATAKRVNGEWKVEKVVMSRTARILMEGQIRIPHFD